MREKAVKNCIDSNCKIKSMKKAQGKTRNVRNSYLIGYNKIRVYNILPNLMPAQQENK